MSQTGTARLHLRLIRPVTQLGRRLAGNYTAAQEPFRALFHVIGYADARFTSSFVRALGLCNGEQRKQQD
jgi:hypothetical protein